PLPATTGLLPSFIFFHVIAALNEPESGPDAMATTEARNIGGPEGRHRIGKTIFRRAAPSGRLTVRSAGAGQLPETKGKSAGRAWEERGPTRVSRHVGKQH